MNVSARRHSIVLLTCLVLSLAAGCNRTPTLAQQGGTVLRYQVAETDHYGRPVDHAAVEPQAMCQALEARLKTIEGVEAATVQADPDKRGVYRIELPGLNDAQLLGKVKQTIAHSGKLEFAIVARSDHHHQLIDWLNDPAHQADPAQRFVGPDDVPLGLWVDIREAPATESGYAIEPSWVTPYVVRDGATGERLDFSDRDAAPDLSAVDNLQLLVVLGDRPVVTGEHLSIVRAECDPATGNPSISFSLNEQGAMEMALLTSSHLPDTDSGFHHHMAILLDGVACSAPRLQSAISDQGMISGNFTQEEVDLMVNVLRTGSLPAPMNPLPISEEQVEPQ